MITFILSLCLLVAGYFVYGRIIERIFGANGSRSTPAVTMADGVDYIPMKPWRIFMIQFLNIAGLGPIFGAIMGAKFGSASYLWIVFGCIFGGAVHDYMSGMMSMRNGGTSLPEIHGKYLNKGIKHIMRVFMVVLMVLVGVVFVNGPAKLLESLTPQVLDATFWIAVILLYYIVATLMPIDKIIGKIYPLFGFCLLFMAVGVLVALCVHHPDIPEIWQGLHNTHPNAAATPVFPMMFISIACGAVSGFHATQSPLMARCMTNEKQGRPIFYGAMIAEGIVALIWAAAATYFFQKNGYGETNAAVIVNDITRSWLGKVGAILAILGVVAAPITSGDTAFRSARLIVADILHTDQKPVMKRLMIAMPLFLVGFGILMFSIKNPNGFDIIWRYFSWANQVLAAVTLLAITLYLVREHKPYIITMVPALFMIMVCSTYIFIAPEGFSLPHAMSYILGGALTVIFAAIFVWRIAEVKKAFK